MKDLANQITRAFFWYNPYNGADFEDVERSVLEGLNSVEECHEMLEQLSAMLLDT